MVTLDPIAETESVYNVYTQSYDIYKQNIVVTQQVTRKII